MKRRFINYLKSSWVGRWAIVPYRAAVALNYTLKPTWKALAWVFTSREHTNQTYDLEDLNIRHLCAMISVVTRTDFHQIESFIQELSNDARLKDHIVNMTRSSPFRFVADPCARFGRRMGWYALIRATKPTLVVETGVDKG